MHLLLWSIYVSLINFFFFWKPAGLKIQPFFLNASKCQVCLWKHIEMHLLSVFDSIFHIFQKNTWPGRAAVILLRVFVAPPADKHVDSRSPGYIDQGKYS